MKRQRVENTTVEERIKERLRLRSRITIVALAHLTFIKAVCGGRRKKFFGFNCRTKDWLKMQQLS